MWSDDAIPGVFSPVVTFTPPGPGFIWSVVQQGDREEVYPPKKRQMPVRFALRSSPLSKILNANPPLFLSLSGFY